MADAADFVRAAHLYPECMLIEAHIGGGGDWEWSIRQLRDAPSVYLDTSGSIIDERMIEMCVEELGAERALLEVGDVTPDRDLVQLAVDQTGQVQLELDAVIRQRG